MQSSFGPFAAPGRPAPGTARARRRRRFAHFGHAALALGLLMLSVACGAPGAPSSGEAAKPGRPARIVSLDFCADQYLLALAERERILALSPDATKNFSYLNEAARGIPTVRPTAEAVLLLKPDLVVRSYGGGPRAAAFFERAGAPVLNIGRAAGIESSEIDSIPAVIERTAAGIGAAERGAELVSEFRARLAALKQRGNNGRSALYMSPVGVTTGPGSLMHEVLTAAGLDNFQKTPGWRSLPLERLAYENPDVIAASFFDERAYTTNTWSATRHPVARAQLREQSVVPIKVAWITCGAWFVMDAIEALAQNGAGAGGGNGDGTNAGAGSGAGNRNGAGAGG